MGAEEAVAAAAAGVAGGLRGHRVSTATCITRVAAAAADGGSNRTPRLWATVTVMTTKVRSAEFWS